MYLRLSTLRIFRLVMSLANLWTAITDNIVFLVEFDEDSKTDL